MLIQNSGYLESASFRHLDAASSYRGKRCLYLFALDEAESARYRRIKSISNRAIWKDVVVSGVQHIGLDGEKLIVKAHKGDIPGTLGALFTFGRKLFGDLDRGGEDRIAASSAEAALYMRLEKIHRWRALDPGVYRYAKNELGIQDASAAYAREGELGGRCVFFFRF